MKRIERSAAVQGKTRKPEIYSAVKKTWPEFLLESKETTLERAAF